MDNLTDILEKQDVTQVVLADANIGQQRIVEILLHCEKNIIQFNMVPDLFNIMTSDIDVHTIDNIPLIGVSQWPLDLFWNRFLKRCEDIAGSIVGLLISAPVILWAACRIKQTSPGPVFYKQERCGENGQPFVLYKLRTMPVDAEASTGPVWTVEGDTRRTEFGAMLREYNLDELPQFWNVLKGDMSLVGPRPERPHFVDQFKKRDHQLHVTARLQAGHYRVGTDSRAAEATPAWRSGSNTICIISRTGHSLSISRSSSARSSRARTRTDALRGLSALETEHVRTVFQNRFPSPNTESRKLYT